ncbi:MAG TPA: hypothetical protein VGQ92_02020 [Actinoplanes sp.]|jgi:hypothetical protein|nr:hypothetical protein [Actinoplanes sp.]
MSVALSRKASDRRPATVTATAGVLGFLGLSAAAGGAAMLSGIGDAAPPGDWLDAIPVVDSWLVPGLVLGVGFGLGSLVATFGVLRRPRWAWLRPVERLSGHHWSWLATLLIGLGQVVWIALELVYLPEPSMLQAVYGVVGVALVLLSLHPAVRRYLAVQDEAAR